MGARKDPGAFAFQKPPRQGACEKSVRTRGSFSPPKNTKNPEEKPKK
jgi:hypothetical protein